MKTGVIFGAGSLGKNIYSLCRESINILFFIDNKAEELAALYGLNEWGGVKIKTPSALKNINVDVVILATLQDRNEIFKQLVSLGISEDKIDEHYAEQYKAFMDNQNNLVKELQNYSRQTDSFYLYCLKGKKADSIICQEEINENLKNTAIILQGPLCLEDNFTYETVLLYGKAFPGSTVIVSTWEDAEISVIERFKEISYCEVVLNRYPEFSGVLNLNYQIVSTMGGIKKALELGKRYCFKTRTDQRFYKLGIIDYMIHLLKIFPVDKSIPYQSSRIISGSARYGSMYMPFWVSDRHTFGRTSDLYKYWNYSLDKCNIASTDKFFVLAKILDKKIASERERVSCHLSAETNIVLDYIKRMEGKEPEISIKRYWELIKKQYIILTTDELGGYWFKYENKYLVDDCIFYTTLQLFL